MAGRSQTLDINVLCIRDLEVEANKKLTKMASEYIAGGAMDLITTTDNCNAFNRLRLLPRVMKDVSKVDPSADCWGVRSKFPLGFSPTGIHGVAHKDAELGVSRAAATHGTNMCLSCWSNSSIEDVIAQSASSGHSNRYSMQLSVVSDPVENLYTIKKAEAAGAVALWITVDLPVLGRRYNEFRNNFTIPSHLDVPNLSPAVRANKGTDPRLGYDKSLTWEKIKWFRENTTMQIWLKGITDPEDAELAVQSGVDGIIVSNHGERQLDGMLSTLDALPGVVKAVNNRIPVHFDGGIRRGSDIFKALALGAKFCFVGRIALWGLGYNGEQGVSLALQILYDEFVACMTMMGCTTVDEIGPHHLARLHLDGVYRRIERSC